MSDYNGWKNYETWCVKLWIDNDQGEHEYWREQAREAWRCADGDADYAHSVLACALKDAIAESAPSLEGMWADLMNAALSEVDWYEIAKAMIEDEEFEEEETVNAG